jgi:hypothetical protein
MSKLRASAIPFGIRASDGIEVDICDVPRGAACECMCPSCNAPLIARKGDVNDWHFAHASKDGHKREVTDCEFSFFVSVCMMSRKILGMADHLELPEGMVYSALKGQYHGKMYAKSLLYAKRSSFRPDNVQIETVWNGMPVDALMQKGKHQVAIFFRCPDKRPAYNYSATKQVDTGVLEIDLTGCLELLYGDDRPKDVKFTTLLEQYLIEKVENKKWLYHPRKAKCQEHVDNTLKLNTSDTLSTRSSSLPVQHTKPEITTDHDGLYQFHCAICHNKWTGEYLKGRFCQRCQSDLYVANKGNI